MTGLVTKSLPRREVFTLATCLQTQWLRKLIINVATHLDCKMWRSMVANRHKKLAAASADYDNDEDDETMTTLHSDTHQRHHHFCFCLTNYFYTNYCLTKLTNHTVLGIHLLKWITQGFSPRGWIIPLPLAGSTGKPSPRNLQCKPACCQPDPLSWKDRVDAQVGW